MTRELFRKMMDDIRTLGNESIPNLRTHYKEVFGTSSGNKDRGEMIALFIEENFLNDAVQDRMKCPGCGKPMVCSDPNCGHAIRLAMEIPPESSPLLPPDEKA